MTVTHELCALLVAASLLGFGCKADRLPPVSEIWYEWIDPFNVNVSWSWERPGNLPRGCEVQFVVYPGTTETPGRTVTTTKRHHVNIYLTGETGPGRWDVRIDVAGRRACAGEMSMNRSTTVKPKKPKGQLVKDFKCVTEPGGWNCSWIPLDPAVNTTLSYRFCEHDEENIKTLKRCDQLYSDGIRNGCYLKDTDVCVLLETDSELKTFKPVLVIPWPQVSFREDGNRLNLTWATPDVGQNCAWNYDICYKECETSKGCKTIGITGGHTEDVSFEIAYDNYCRYEFEFKVKSGRNCLDVQSDGSKIMTYGSNRSPAQPLKSTIVIASILSVILSVSLVLTCYCFRRHRDIFCPSIPDPSAIFKGMMVSGNKDLMTTTNHLYTPMPEAVESCRLSPVSENSLLQETP